MNLLYIFYCRDSIKEDIPLLKPRRNSIDISKESEEADKKYENQVSDFKHRRYGIEHIRFVHIII